MAMANPTIRVTTAVLALFLNKFLMPLETNDTFNTCS